MFCDTHTHLYLPEFDADRSAMIQRSLQEGITRFYLPNIDLSSLDALEKMSSEYPINCFPMMGLHPCSVKSEHWKNHLEKIGELFFSGDYCAVGEIGLDYYWDTSTIGIQKEALRIQCEWALEKSKPVSLHSRNATRECIDVIKPFASKGMKGIFHCFSGSEDEAAEIVEMDFLIGIGGVITFKNSNLPEVIRKIPPSSVVLETDAPYLAPVPHRGKRNEPSFIPLIALKLSEIYGKPVEEIAEITTRNALSIFSHEE